MLLDVPLAYLTLVPLREKGLDAAAACGVVKLRGQDAGRKKGKRKRRKRRERSCRGSLSRTGSKHNNLVGLICRLMGLEWLDCKCCRKKYPLILKKVANGNRLVYF